MLTVHLVFGIGFEFDAFAGELIDAFLDAVLNGFGMVGLRVNFDGFIRRHGIHGFEGKDGGFPGRPLKRSDSKYYSNI